MLSATFDGCAKRYERFCQRYRHKSKGAPKCHWGSRILKRLVSSARTRSKKNKISPGQQRLPLAWDIRLNQIPEDWHQLAVIIKKMESEMVIFSSRSESELRRYRFWLEVRS